MVILLGFLFVRAGGDSARYYIENLTNFNEASQEPMMGAITYDEGRTTYDQLAESVLQEKVVTVASASVATIAATAIELLPDAGTGKVNQVISITGFRKFSSESFGFKSMTQSHEGFEIKWGSADVSTVGLNGQVALGASFSRGFTTGGLGDNGGASRSAEYWMPSIASISLSGYNFPVLASQSAVYLTASSAFSTGSNQAQGTFLFKILYRILSSD